MVRSQTLLQTRNKNYDIEALKKGKSIGETSNPLTIEKPAETMPKIPKGVFKKTLHNPNARVAALGSMDSSSLMVKFNLSNVKIHLLYHVALLIDVIHGRKTIGRVVVDEGASTCVMSLSC